MAFLVFSTLTMIFLIYFTLTPKHLHFFEMAMIWLLVVFLHENYSTIVMLNLGWIKHAEGAFELVSFFIMFVLLFPALIIWCIDRVSIVRSAAVKLLIVILVNGLMIGLEYLAQYLGVYEPKQGYQWWYAAEALSLTGFAFLVDYGFRIVLRKEVRLT